MDTYEFSANVSTTDGPSLSASVVGGAGRHLRARVAMKEVLGAQGDSTSSP